MKLAVRLTFPWTDPDGVKHRQGTSFMLDRATANTLVRGGRAVRIGPDHQPRSAEETTDTDVLSADQPGTPAEGE